jgi:hypothetical protein
VVIVIFESWNIFRHAAVFQLFSLFIRRGVATFTLIHIYDNDSEVRTKLSPFRDFIVGGVCVVRAVR